MAIGLMRNLVKYSSAKSEVNAYSLKQNFKQLISIDINNYVVVFRSYIEMMEFIESFIVPPRPIIRHLLN